MKKIELRKKDAIETMKKGVRIKHDNLAKSNWMSMEMGYMIFNNWKPRKFSEFWDLRTDDSWDDGYYVSENKKK